MEEYAIYQDYQRAEQYRRDQVSQWQPSEDEQELFKEAVQNLFKDIEPENEDLEF